MVKFRTKRTVVLVLTTTGIFILYFYISTIAILYVEENEENHKKENVLHREKYESGQKDIHKRITTQTNLTEEEVKQYVKEAEADNGVRLLRVQDVCHRYNLGLYKHSADVPAFKQPPTPQYSVFYIDKVHKLSWCPVYKAASTTWLYNLCILGGYSEEFLANTKQQLSELARKVYPEMEYAEAEEAFQSTMKLLVVRHPFERLLSAYRDKLENSRVGREHGTGHYYTKYGARIVAKYRAGGNQTRTQTLLSPGQYDWNPELPEPAGGEPTFEEFVRYLIDVDIVLHSDDHWIPYYLFCTPCLLKYDFIAKVETLMRDQLYVIRSAGLQDAIKPRWRHQTAKQAEGDISVVRKYYSQLDAVQMKRLYGKYKLDFELFGYQLDNYLNYAKHS